MKVLAAIVVPPHLSASGGARAAEELSAALAEHCDITVASMMNGAGSPPRAAQPGWRRRTVTSRAPALLASRRLPNRARTLFYRSDLPRIVAEGDFDLVHIHNPMPSLEMARVARACRAKGVPYVVSTHGFNEVANGAAYGMSGLKRLLWGPLVQRPVSEVVANAAGVFALSPADFDIVRAMGFVGEEMTVVPNGAPAVAPLSKREASEALARLDLPQDDEGGRITCAFLANHTPNKGLPVLLEAFAGLEAPFLLLVGGERRDGVDYEAAQRACGPNGRIVITGRLSDLEVRAMLSQADLFVFPTLADTFPLVVIEAMAHGLPVVASRVGGIPYQLEEDSGVLVEPGDVAGLRQAVERLAADPAGRARMGRRAQARAAREFSWEKAAEIAAAAYRRVLERDGLPKGQSARRPIAQRPSTPAPTRLGAARSMLR